MRLRLKCGFPTVELMHAYSDRSAINKLLLLITTISLIGCASGPRFADYEKRVPPPRTGYGRIWFYRESRFYASLRQPEILLNEEKIGNAKPGSFFYVDRPAGNYVVTCESGGINECRLVLAPESTRYVRFSIVMGVWLAQIVPQEVSRTTALKELADL
jgi:hypothetical protein